MCFFCNKLDQCICLLLQNKVKIKRERSKGSQKQLCNEWLFKKTIMNSLSLPLFPRPQLDAAMMPQP
jgi:hypothetical protein